MHQNCVRFWLESYNAPLDLVDLGGGYPYPRPHSPSTHYLVRFLKYHLATLACSLFSCWAMHME